MERLLQNSIIFRRMVGRESFPCHLLFGGILMLNMFYPDEEIDSVYSYDFSKAYKEGIRGVIFDIDNTLVPHGFPADKKSIAFFRELHDMGIRTVLLSNNKEPRVKKFASKVESDYIFKAGKPGKKGYLQAMEKMNTTKKDTIFVGDQLFTDVWGAKRVGIKSILSRPIHPKEEIQIVFKRYLEKIVLHFYHKRLEGKKK